MHWETITKNITTGLQKTYVTECNNKTIQISIFWLGEQQTKFQSHILETNGKGFEMTHFYNNISTSSNYDELCKNLDTLTRFKMNELELITIEKELDLYKKLITTPGEIEQSPPKIYVNKHKNQTIRMYTCWTSKIQVEVQAYILKDNEWGPELTNMYSNTFMDLDYPELCKKLYTVLEYKKIELELIAKNKEVELYENLLCL
jgi:hypothetical protein